MFKKLLIAAVAVFVGLTLVKKTELGGVIRSWWRDVRASVKSQVPPEAKVEELKAQIGKIDQEIKKHIGTLARMEVSRDQVKEEIEIVKGRIAKLRGEVAGMIDSLGKDSNVTRVSYNGEPYRRTELTAKLERTTADLENSKAKLKFREDQLAAQRQAVEAAKQRLDEMRDQKDRLAILADRLKTQIELVRLRELQNRSIDVDDSAVSECNRLAADIETQLREMEKKTQLMVEYGYKAPTATFERETKPTADVLEAAKKALEEDRADETALAGKK
jgi:flagellar biosynthesis chaperone FliJ